MAFCRGSSSTEKPACDPGNPGGHLILRGGSNGPNFDPVTIQNCVESLQKKSLCDKILIDCSHGNSGKQHVNQPKVFRNVISQIKNGNSHIFGMMLESNLFEGNQPQSDSLKYGVSITDECMGWDTTADLIREAVPLLQA